MDEKNNQKYLISISIGPVQDFIASARRSRDLWFGSWLLSELSKAAARTIVTQSNGNLSSLIFPAVTSMDYLDNTKEFSVVNKIVALVENPSTIGEAIEKTMNGRLEEIWTKTQKRITGNFDRAKAKLQIDDLVEFFWAAVRIEKPEGVGEYEKARERVEYLLAARKATRNFISTKAWSGNVPKSSLDGQRESVIHEDIYKSVRDKKMTKEELRKQFGVREGERLCGVGLLKRHGNRGNNDSFFSTSHVASLPFLEFLEYDAAKNKSAFNEYLIELSRLLNQTIEESELYKFLGKTPKAHSVFENYDGHILFEERLSEFFTDKDNLNAAKKALRGFFNIVRVKQSELSPYYALLLADGDAMGKAIDAQKNKTDHQNLSAELSLFAKDVRKIVELTHRGSLVYTGGDDVLAFVPLHTVLDCAKELADLFAQRLKQFEITEKDRTYSPTLSVGIAVAHHLEPLEDALELARKAEKAAKSIEGKNALAVIVDKRSGTSRMLKGKWETVDERLKQFVEWHLNKENLNSAAYQLKDLAIRLETSEQISEADKSILEKAKLAEAKRILERKDISEPALRDLKKYLHDIGEVLKKDFTDSGSDEKQFTDKSVKILADELIIAKIFADAKRLAQPKKEKEDE